MARIKQETIQQIMDASRIEEVVMDFVQLKKQGQSFRGLSPFQTEKTPSFYVVPSKQIFKDFSSGKGGNVITFLMEHESMSYPEALRWLAGKYNIEIEEAAEADPEEKAAADERESLMVLNAYAQRKFSEQLMESEEGRSIGLSYFKERGFLESTIEKFQLGYCVDKNDAFSQQAIKDGYQREFLLKAGLGKEGKFGLYDFYRGRVIFPIHNFSGRVIAFAGRALKSGQQPKYVNSPETPVYHKSNVLYGLHLARNTMRKLDECFIVEGYTDVISLVQGGIENVVASSGTALTKGQIRQVRKLTENITMLYDGDQAGIKAALRGVDLILEEGMQVRVVILPEGEDPDTFMKSQGSEGFGKYIEENRQDFVLLKIGMQLEELAGDPGRKTELVRDMVNTIARIPDPIKRAVYIRECSQRLDVPEQLLFSQVNLAIRSVVTQKRKQDATDAAAAERQAAHESGDPAIDGGESVRDPSVEIATDIHERELLRVMLEFGQRELDEEHPSVNAYVLEEAEEADFINDSYRALFAEIVRLEDQKHPDIGKAIIDGGGAHAGLVVDIISDRYQLSDGWLKKFNIHVNEKNYFFERDIENTVNRFKLQKSLRLLRELEKRKDSGLSEAEIMQMLRVKKKVDSLRVEVSKHLGQVILPREN